MMSIPKPYKKSFIGAICVHIAIFVAMFIGFTDQSHPPVMPTPAKKMEPKRIVKAGLVDKSAIDEAVKRQAKKEQQKIAEEKKRQNALKAEEKRIAEAKKKALAQKREAERLKKQTEKLKAEANLLKEKAAKEKLAAEKAKKVAEEEKKRAQQQKEKLIAEAKALKEKQEKEKREQAERAERQRVLEIQKVEGEVHRYMSIIQQQVSQNWTTPYGMPKELACVLEIFLLPDGSVQDVKIQESSGNQAYDELAVRTVWRSSPLRLPRSEAARSQFRHFNFRFQPEVS